MADKLTLTVQMDVTPPQALALQAMFEYWTRLGGIGSSRYVAFYCDGDGNFQPKCRVAFSSPIPLLTDELRKKAVVKECDGDRWYDFDPVAWALRAAREGRP
jgi:hypothetical protein